MIVLKIISCAFALSFALVELVLLRHGIAVERAQGLDHPDRELTTLGRQRTLQVCCRLHELWLKFDGHYSSPYRRAQETADLAVKSGLAPAMRIATCLQPGGDPWPLVQELRGSCLFVGHEPDLSELASELIGARSEALRLRKAGICHLRWSRDLHPNPRGLAQLQGLMSPRLLLPRSV